MKSLFSNQLITTLFFLNVLFSFVIFLISKNSVFPDQTDYLSIAYGILSEGQFSSWTELDGDYPNTLRTPGYPFFLSGLLALNESLIFIKSIQFLIHLFCLILALKIITKLGGANRSLVFFLVLSLLSLQLPFYSGYISSETLTIFLVLLSIYLLVHSKLTLKRYFLLGVLFGLITLTRPAFLLLPLAIIFIMLYKLRASALKNVFVIVLGYFICLTPYSAWNYKHHSTFQPTSIEGSASIMHMGYWSQKLPEGYQSTFDNYQTTVVKDIFYPIKLSDMELSKNLREYEAEWHSVNSKLINLSKDPNIVLMINSKEKFPTYSSEYTIKREKLLRDETILNIKENPEYFVLSRLYNFIRVFFTGLSHDSLSKDKSFFEKSRNLYAFLSTFFIILGGFIFLTIYLIKNFVILNNHFLYLYTYIIYTAAIHTPFTVQARYTIPIHFIILILLSLVLSGNGLKSAKK